MSFKPLIFIVGPTAVGKSHLAVLAAEECGGAILNCDSVQSFAEVQIGAAKPAAADRARVPHYLFDWVPAGEDLTASQFRDKALATLADLLPRQTVFAVGGSGFYIRALEKGMYPVADVAQEVHDQLDVELKNLGSEALHTELLRLDPAYAAKVAPADAYRVTRALALIRSEGRTVTEIQRDFELQAAASRLPYAHFKVGLELDRETLRQRVLDRTSEMLMAGLLAEVEGLLKRGLRDWAPLSSVGYRECVAHIEGRLSKDELADAIAQSTMQLAKKQMTWFKRDRDIKWFNVAQGLVAPLEYVRSMPVRASP